MRLLLKCLLSCTLMMAHVAVAQVVKGGFIKTSDGTSIHYIEAGEEALEFKSGAPRPKHLQ